MALPGPSLPGPQFPGPLPELPLPDPPALPRSRLFRLRPRRPRLPKLTTAVRLGLLFIGWLLILLGFVGIFLPILQGAITFTLGAAVLSLVSEGIFLLLRRIFRGWPKGWRRLLGVRRKIQLWLEKKFHRPARE